MKCRSIEPAPSNPPQSGGGTRFRYPAAVASCHHAPCGGSKWTFLREVCGNRPLWRNVFLLFQSAQMRLCFKSSFYVCPMPHDALQLQRFELKYVISETLTPAIRDFVQQQLHLDPNGEGRPDNSYPIHSLYLDSDALALYWATVNGTRNRYKLRLRYYEDRSDAPVFFEIKRRNNEAILKQRCGVHRAAVPRVLAGHSPSPDELLSDDPKQIGALERFTELALGLRASPKTHVAYRREAWVSWLDNSVRVTMDRDVRFEPQLSLHLGTQIRNPILVFGNKVVLEIKFTGSFPTWLGEMVRVFGLERRSAAKYAEGVAILGDDRFQPGQSMSFSGVSDDALPESGARVTE
jgi:hypothetical protein